MRYKCMRKGQTILAVVECPAELRQFSRRTVSGARLTRDQPRILANLCRNWCWCWGHRRKRWWGWRWCNRRTTCLASQANQHVLCATLETHRFHPVVAPCAAFPIQRSRSGTHLARHRDVRPCDSVPAPVLGYVRHRPARVTLLAQQLVRRRMPRIATGLCRANSQLVVPGEIHVWHCASPLS